MDELNQLKQITELAGGYSVLKWKDGKKAYFPMRNDDGAPLPITDDVIRAHLDGTQPIGINMNVGDRKSHFAVFDFDDHGGKNLAAVMLLRVGIVAAALRNQKVPHFVVRSGGGAGYHIWIVFENASRDDVIRKRMHGILDAATALMKKTAWPDESFVPDDGEGKGMFHEGTTHFVECLPKGGEWPVIALPLAQKSVVMTPREIPGDQGQVEFDEGGPLLVQKARPGKPGPKSGTKSRAVDVEAAVEAFAKVRPGGDYGKWVASGFVIKAAFGAEGLAQFMQYSRLVDGFTGEKDVQDKWDDIKQKPSKAKAEAFWAYARAGGYSGGLPDDIKLNGSDVGKEILTDVVESLPLYRDRDGKAYAEIAPRRAVPIKSEDFADWLMRAAYGAGQIVSQETIKAAQSLARAHADDRREVYLRVARVDGAVYVDCADDDNSVVRITGDAIQEVASSPAFRRSRQLPLQGDLDGTLDDIRALLNMDDDQFVVFMACAAKMYFPDSPSPIVSLIGEYGAAKTSTAILLRTLVDPVPAMTTAGTAKGKEEDLLLRCWHNAVLSLENMSSLASISDTLCGICTGNGFETRALFTDTDLSSIWVRRPVIINGIDPTKHASDLISRMVEIELQRPEKRMKETVFEARVKEMAPRMVGAVWKLVRDVQKMLPDIDEAPDELRLSAFAEIGECVARIMGKDDGWFYDYLVEQQAEQQEEAADDSPLVQALEHTMTTLHGAKFFGTSQELLRLVQKAPEECGGIRAELLPKTASHLSRDIKTVQGELRRRGWEIKKETGVRKWLIAAPPEVTDI